MGMGSRAHLHGNARSWAPPGGQSVVSVLLKTCQYCPCKARAEQLDNPKLRMKAKVFSAEGRLSPDGQ